MIWLPDVNTWHSCTNALSMPQVNAVCKRNIQLLFRPHSKMLISAFCCTLPGPFDTKGATAEQAIAPNDEADEA